MEIEMVKQMTHGPIYRTDSNGEGSPHISDRIYLASIWYVQCFQTHLHNADNEMGDGAIYQQANPTMGS